MRISDWSSDVCSSDLYLLRDGALELYATRCLKQEAVHVTKLALGQGLVSTIAKNIETLNLDEATSHPDFVHNPETGAELFHSFAGVPIVRREKAVGVLAGQHVDPTGMPGGQLKAVTTMEWCVPNSSTQPG